MPRTDWSQTWMEYHTLGDPCNHQTWCRLHWCTVWDSSEFRMVPRQYPVHFNIPSSRNGWQRVMVACGPSAFYPKKGKY